MASKALLVGINEYRMSPLRGCVNDIRDVADFLVSKFDFDAKDIRLLADHRATKAEIVHELTALVGSLRAGDRAVFHFSGHGVQLRSVSVGMELDELDEAVCPVDFTWEDARSALRDKEFHAIFSRLPSGSNFVWISDSCHSGDISREVLHDRFGARPRCLEPPIDIAWQVQRVRARAARGRVGMRDVADHFRLALLTGCEADKTSADAVFDGRANGALTYYLLGELGSYGGLSRKLLDVTRRVGDALASNGFSQRPQIEGAPELHERPFLSPRMTAPPVEQAATTSSGGMPPWYEVFVEIERRVAGDRAFERDLIASNERASRALARERRIELEQPAADASTEPARPRGGTVARAFWWGFHVQISHEDLIAFVDAANPINAIAAALGPVTGPAAPWVGLIAAFIAGALQLLRSLDRGRGVYVSMSWFAPGVFIPTTV